MLPRGTVHGMAVYLRAHGASISLFVPGAYHTPPHARAFFIFAPPLVGTPFRTHQGAICTANIFRAFAPSANLEGIAVLGNYSHGRRVIYTPFPGKRAPTNGEKDIFVTVNLDRICVRITNIQDIVNGYSGSRLDSLKMERGCMRCRRIQNISTSMIEPPII